MGWTGIPGLSKSDIVREQLRGWEDGDRSCKAIKLCFRGNVAYSVHEYRGPGGEFECFAMVTLVQGPKGNHYVKAMDETMHPFYYAFPVGWLDLLTEPTNENARRWREGVREYAKGARLARRLRAAFKARGVRIRGCSTAWASGVLSEPKGSNRRAWAARMLRAGRAAQRSA